MRFFTIIQNREIAIIERLGKFSKVIRPGIHLLIPYIDRLRNKVSLKE